MFYLTHLFKFLLAHPLRSFSYLVISGAFIVGLFTQERVNRYFDGLGKNEQQLPYFHALVSGRENHSRISRNLQKLPGVEKVEILAEQKIREQVEEIVGGLSSDLSESFLSLNYAGLKIIFSKGLQGNSIDLIRDYLKRLVGETKVTLGPVQANTIKEVDVSFLWQVLSQHTYYTMIVTLALIWLCLGASLAVPWCKQAHLIEQFQRREKVAFKSFILLNILVLGIFSIVGLLIGRPSMLLVLVVLFGSIPTLMTLRKVSWH